MVSASADGSPAEVLGAHADRLVDERDALAERWRYLADLLDIDGADATPDNVEVRVRQLLTSVGRLDDERESLARELGFGDGRAPGIDRLLAAVRELKARVGRAQSAHGAAETAAREASVALEAAREQRNQAVRERTEAREALTAHQQAQAQEVAQAQAVAEAVAAWREVAVGLYRYATGTSPDPDMARSPNALASDVEKALDALRARVVAQPEASRSERDVALIRALDEVAPRGDRPVLAAQSSVWDYRAGAARLLIDILVGSNG